MTGARRRVLAGLLCTATVVIAQPGEVGAGGAGGGGDGSVLALVGARTADGGTGTLVCVSPGTRPVTVGELPFVPFGAIRLGDRIWVTSEESDTTLAEVDPGNGEVVGTVEIGAPTQDIVSDGRNTVWVRTQDGVLVAVDAERREVVGTVETPAFTDYLAAAPGVLWAATMGGSVYRVDPDAMKITETLAVAPLDQQETLNIGALGVGDDGSLWLAMTALGAVVRIDPERHEPTLAVRYGSEVPEGSFERPGARLVVDDRDAWLFVNSLPGVVEEPLLVRVGIEKGTGQRRRVPDALLSPDHLLRTDSALWLSSDDLRRFDPAANRFEDFAIDTGTGVVAVLPGPCTGKETGGGQSGGRGGDSGRRASKDVDAGGGALDPDEVGALDLEAFVVTDLPPEWDVPPDVEETTGTRFERSVCGDDVTAPERVAAIEYGRPGPEFITETISVWEDPDDANQALDDIRDVVRSCERYTEQNDVTLTPIESPVLPDELGDEWVVLSREATQRGSDVIVETHQVFIRRGQFLFEIAAPVELLPDLAAAADASLDALVSGSGPG